jgi:hypothetical protein
MPNYAALVLHPVEPGLDQGGQLAEVALGEVGQGPLEVRPHQFDRVEFVGLGRELADGQPVPGGDQVGHRAASALIAAAGRPQRAMRAASGAACPAWEGPSVSVRWCPVLSAHLVTLSLAIRCREGLIRLQAIAAGVLVMAAFAIRAVAAVLRDRGITIARAS